MEKMTAKYLRAGVTVVGPDGIWRSVMNAEQRGDVIHYTAAKLGGEPEDFSVKARAKINIVTYHND